MNTLGMYSSFMFVLAKASSIVTILKLSLTSVVLVTPTIFALHRNGSSGLGRNQCSCLFFYVVKD